MEQDVDLFQFRLKHNFDKVFAFCTLNINTIVW